MDNYTAWNSQTARKSSINLVMNQAKAKEVEREKLIENAVNALVTSERVAEPRLISMEDPRNPHPKEKVLGVARKKNQKHRKMCHWGPLIWGPLRCCQTTVTPQKMTSTLTNLHKKPQKLCHRCRLLPGLRRQGLQSIQRCIAGSFGNLAMETVETKSLHFLIVGIVTFCSTRILWHETDQSLYLM